MSMSGASIRDVGRHAIRLRLARVAFERFCLRGFGRVTFDELADAAGVSRSTFLRYFRTKEDAVLFVFDLVGETVAAAFGSDEGGEPGHRCRTAVRTAAAQLLRETPELQAVMDLIRSTPELQAGLLAKQALWWETALPVVLAATPDEDEAVVEARLASGLACLNVALRRWSSDSEDDLQAILDRALTAVR